METQPESIFLLTPAAVEAPNVSDELQRVRVSNTRERSLCAFARVQAATLLEAALDEEVRDHLARHAGIRAPDGRPAVVRNGLQPIRHILTNIGAIPVRIPKVRSRSACVAPFRSVIARPYLRRSRAIVEGAPLRFLRGLSRSDVHECLYALMGPDGVVLPGRVMSRLKARWEQPFGAAVDGQLSQVDCQSLWLTSFDCSELDPSSVERFLIVIGTDPMQNERIFALKESLDRGAREWQQALSRLRDRGLRVPGRIEIGDPRPERVVEALDRVFPGVMTLEGS